jgi:hypothetical protein
MAGSQDIGYGFQDPTVVTSHFNTLAFIIEQALGQVRTVVPVKVLAVHTTGDIPAIGTVDVQVAVNQFDGLGNATKHGKTFGLTYFRLQGGNNGVISDPVVGDIGLALICDRDISALKQNKDISNPGSYRRFDIADGVYLGKILGQAPNFFLMFDTANGITLTTNGSGAVTAKSNSGAAGGVNLVLSDSTAGQMVSIGPSGVRIQAKQQATIVDQNGNTVQVGPTGVTITDQTGNQLTTSAAGVTFTDTHSNTVTLGAGGISVTTSGTVGITGNIAVTGNITATGSITAGLGGGDQIGLQTHKHPANNQSPTPGT